MILSFLVVVIALSMLRSMVKWKERRNLSIVAKLTDDLKTAENKRRMRLQSKPATYNDDLIGDARSASQLLLASEKLDKATDKLAVWVSRAFRMDNIVNGIWSVKNIRFLPYLAGTLDLEVTRYVLGSYGLEQWASIATYIQIISRVVTAE